MAFFVAAAVFLFGGVIVFTYSLFPQTAIPHITIGAITTVLATLLIAITWTILAPVAIHHLGRTFLMSFALGNDSPDAKYYR